MPSTETLAPYHFVKCGSDAPQRKAGRSSPEPPSEQFGFLPIMLLALLAMAVLVGVVVFTRHRRKGRK